MRGSYAATELAVMLHLNIDILETFSPRRQVDTVEIDGSSCETGAPKQRIPRLEPLSERRIAKITELQEFTLQVQLSDKMSYLTALTLGILRFYEGRYDEANASLTAAIEVVSGTASAGNQGTALSYRALVLEKMGDLMGTLQDYGATIELDRSFVSAYFNGGILLIRQRKYREAVDWLTPGVEYGHERLHELIGKALIYLAEYDRALDHLDQAIHNDPDGVYAYVDRGVAYHNTGQLQKAIEDYTRALAIDPCFADAYKNRGSANRILGRVSEALDDWETYLSLAPQAEDWVNIKGLLDELRRR